MSAKSVCCDSPLAPREHLAACVREAVDTDSVHGCFLLTFAVSQSSWWCQPSWRRREGVDTRGRTSGAPKGVVCLNWNFLAEFLLHACCARAHTCGRLIERVLRLHLHHRRPWHEGGQQDSSRVARGVKRENSFRINSVNRVSHLPLGKRQSRL